MGLENLSEHEPEAPQFEDPNHLEPRDVAGVDAVGTQILQVLDSPEQVSDPDSWLLKRFDKLIDL